MLGDGARGGEVIPWFAGCLLRAVEGAEDTLAAVLGNRLQYGAYSSNS